MVERSMVVLETGRMTGSSMRVYIKGSVGVLPKVSAGTMQKVIVCEYRMRK